MSKRASTAKAGMSPRKSTKAAQQQQQYEPVDQNPQVNELYSQAQFTISEQEVEIERLKTTVVALNAKCSIVDDHKTDVQNTTIRHTESESFRVELHSHITTTTEKVHADNAAHTSH
jgi:hypothetical protein